ncbi:uncharacterized protein LOC106151386 isoform X2 [Lingula anatina]|uniref:Uncharacterized protein LOC106151386 isoform X2 n=1 Tax=Lingula anatina TaxID=7574 RepID=A0A1S3H2A5_LINAN|nr:uncharacterized protein LOC106151386 isoform X2 [Lingula anatina]|eukprot:XP_013380072.1 uncharacterized protein LOC106151386 isoform X2 [Lingula anatina]
MKMELFGYLVAVVAVFHAANGNTIAIDIPSVTTSPGENVQLKCTFDGTWGIGFNMQWLKDGNAIAAPSSVNVNQDFVGRFSLDLSPPVYTLQITGIEIGDAGNYECAFTISGTVQQTLSSVVTVIAAPTDVFLYHGNMSNKISGGPNYMFEDRVESVVGCAALGGQPAPVLEVSIGDSVQTDFNSVTLDPTTDAAIQNDKFALGVQDANKKIKCTWKTPDATNPRDQGSVEVTLTIGYKPIIQCENNRVAYKGDAVYLICTVYAMPEASNFWWEYPGSNATHRINGSATSPQDSRIVSTMEDLTGKNVGKKITLTISSVSKDDAVEYTLYAMNSHGHSQKAVAVTFAGEVSMASHIGGNIFLLASSLLLLFVR